MSDIMKKIEYLKNYDVSVELNYRMNFDADKTCGYIKLFKGDITNVDEEYDDVYEIYMELYDCGLSEDELMKGYYRLVEEIENGSIDVDL